jgi:hypothetical protein
MTPADLGTTNVWLALIAIASLIQSAILVAVLVGALRFYRRTESRIDELKRDVLEPMQARANRVMGEMEDVMARVRAMDDRVTNVVTRTTDGLGLVATVARRKLWPVVGLVRGVRAVLGALADKRRQTKALVNLNEDEKQRFSYEGGPAYARTANLR